MRRAAKRGQERIGHCDHAEDVGLVGAAEDLDVGLGDRCSGVVRDTGVVDQDVEVEHGGRRRRRDRVRVHHVEQQGTTAELSRSRRAAGLVAGADENGPPTIRELTRECRPIPPVAPVIKAVEAVMPR
jgi:hypothetical protein